MNLVLAITGATGAHAARILTEKSPWPIALVASRYGRDVYERECGPFDQLTGRVDRVYDNDDLSAAIASGSVLTVGMVILPCSVATMGRIAGGIADNLITRAAHCHLKERRKLILCVREAPWTLIDIENASRVTSAGGIIMPISPPFYMTAGRDPDTVTMSELLALFVDRVLAVLGHGSEADWETVR